MLAVDKSPQHMLQAVWSIEHGKQEPFGEAVQFIHHHGFAFFEDQFALRGIGTLVKTPVIVASVVFRHTHGGE